MAMVPLGVSRSLLYRDLKSPSLEEGQTFEAVSLFVGRPFQAVVTAKNGQFRRPKKGVVHLFTTSSARVG